MTLQDNQAAIVLTMQDGYLKMQSVGEDGEMVTIANGFIRMIVGEIDEEPDRDFFFSPEELTGQA